MKKVLFAVIFAIILCVGNVFAQEMGEPGVWNVLVPKSIEPFTYVRRITFILGLFFMVTITFFALFKKISWFWLFGLFSWLSAFGMCGLITDYIVAEYNTDVFIPLLFLFFLYLLPILMILLQ